MRRVILFILFIFLLTTSYVAGTDEVQKKQTNITLIPVSESEIGMYRVDASKNYSNPEAVCDGKWQGPSAYIYPSWFVGNEYYAAYQDPTETGCTNTYPFSVQIINWIIQNEVAGTEFDIQPLIYTADLSDPTCPKPGVIKYSGSVYHVTLANTGSIVIGMPISCCVEGPYFAGFYVPTYLGTNQIDLIVDNGTSSPFLIRECASFNNWQGFWSDLVVNSGFNYNMKLWSEGVNSEESICDPCGAVTIAPGVDIWKEYLGGGEPGKFILNTVFPFGTWAQPIPADFFGPGSDPFDGIIAFEGEPVLPSEFGSACAVIERTEKASLPSVGSSDDVDIQLVALKLVSSIPISVSYNGGMSYEHWSVEMCLSEFPPSSFGTIEFTRDCCHGGTFNWNLFFIPKFIFSHPIYGERIYDFNLMGGTAIPADIVHDGVWTTDIHPAYEAPPTSLYDGWHFSPGNISYDEDCTSNTPSITIGPSSQVLYYDRYYYDDTLGLVLNPCCCVGIAGDVDCNGAVEPDISDIVRLIDFLYLSKNPLCCPEEAETSGDCGPEPDISDIVRIIDYLYLATHTPPVACGSCAK